MVTTAHMTNVDTVTMAVTKVVAARDAGTAARKGLMRVATAITNGARAPVIAVGDRTVDSHPLVTVAAVQPVAERLAVADLPLEVDQANDADLDLVLVMAVAIVDAATGTADAHEGATHADTVEVARVAIAAAPPHALASAGHRVVHPVSVDRPVFAAGPNRVALRGSVVGRRADVRPVVARLVVTPIVAEAVPRLHASDRLTAAVAP